jgi:NAD+ kinase
MAHLIFVTFTEEEPKTIGRMEILLLFVLIGQSLGFVSLTSKSRLYKASVNVEKETSRHQQGRHRSHDTSFTSLLLARKQSLDVTQRTLDLMWCSDELCRDAIRETVNSDNEIVLNGPATGQVVYHWTNPDTSEPCVLLLIKPNDAELYQRAADTVLALIESKINILLDPITAARLKHYHGVDDDRIHLFEAVPTPGYGSNLHESEDHSFAPAAIHKSPDLIVTLGGDGLLMHAGMLFQGPVPPILCIAGGSLGFLTPFLPTEMVDVIKVALGVDHTLTQADEVNLTAPRKSLPSELDVFPPNMPSYPYEPLDKASPQDTPFGRSFDRICLSIRMRLECSVIGRDGRVRSRYNVLNEVVIDRGSSPYLAALECFCDDVHLTTVQADGVIFATPTGSTAYSLAAGSSVVHPAVPCILVTPICPHVLSFRSMVFPDSVTLSCFVPDDARSEASVAFDGKHRQELRRGDSVSIKMSPYPVPTINRKDHSADWLDSLKRNFNFNARPRQKPL